MKKHIASACIALIVVTNVSSMDTIQGGSKSVDAKLPAKLSQEQRKYLDNYCRKRNLAIFLCHLKGYFWGMKNDQVTLEDLRPLAAEHCDLPRESKWEQFVTVKKYQKYITEDNRRKFAKVICGDEKATWVEILESIENMRKRRNAGEVSLWSQGDRESPFSLAEIGYNACMNRSVVEQIKERLPINEVIGQYLKLEKSGNAYKAKCPFHNEKTPSFFVSPDRGGYYCFGCNAKGDIFTFVEQFEGLDFRGALKVLAERAGVQLTFDKKADGERDKLFDVMESAAAFFEDQYAKNKEAKDYIKRRGIKDVTREEFRIGWAPEGWSNLHVYLKKKGFSDALIEKAGLIKSKSQEIGDKRLEIGESQKATFPVSSLPASAEAMAGKQSPISPSYYDRFRGRIIFPIFDSSGRVVAFSGRILKDDGKSAKYLNSPDTPLYDKSLVLYGLDKAKSEIRRMNYTIMVEGQMDLVMSHQAGIRNTVASSGTALTDEEFSNSGAISNLGLVRRLSPNIIIAFDSDSAGRKAAMRAAGIALSMGMDVKIADLVGGKDPADLVLHNPDDWKNALRSAKPIIEFELGNVMRDVEDQRKVGRALRERVFPFLARIESRMDQAHYVKMISDKTNISETAVWDDLRKVKVESAKSATTSDGRFGPSEGEGEPAADSAESDGVSGGGGGDEAVPKLDLIARRLFGLLFHVEKEFPDEGKNYRNEIKKIASDSYGKIISQVETNIEDLAFEAEAVFGSNKEDWIRHMKELVVNFEEDIIGGELVSTMSELKKAEKAGDMKLVTELAKKCQVLSIRKAEVAKKKLA